MKKLNVRTLLRKAKDHLVRQEHSEAEKIYHYIVKKYPGNIEAKNGIKRIKATKVEAKALNQLISAKASETNSLDNRIPTGPSIEAFVKSPHPSTKHTTYFPVYDKLFEKYRGREITFVEIGILDGGSLFMWREFFGPKARIIGIDLDPAVEKWGEHNFEIHVGSQSSPEFWKNFFDTVGPVDVVLDDGGHTYMQQIVTCECALQQINNGGMLVVEDTHTSYMDGFGDQSMSFINYCKVWIDKINSRFSSFGYKQADRRVWSIELFESIVAFKVDQRNSDLMSQGIMNTSAPIGSTDEFRYADQKQTLADKETVKSLMKDAFEIYR